MKTAIALASAPRKSEDGRIQMKVVHLFFVLLLLMAGTSCTGQGKEMNSSRQGPGEGQDPQGYRWTKLADSAAFPKSYNFQMFSLRDTLWVFHFDGVWFSPDGTTWTKSRLPNVVRNIAFLKYVWHNRALIGLGSFEGNIERYQLTTAIHKTADLKTWDLLAQESNLPRRFFYQPFVFKGHLWIIGGNDGNQKHADAWRSDNGVQWQKVADDLPFGPRDRQQFVEFQGRLYMLDDDVWSSADGLSWKKETDRIAEGTIFGYAAVVFDDKIWLLGCNRDGKFRSEVLVSTNGREWSTQQAPWSPRGAVAACVHKGSLYLTGGKYGGHDGNEATFVYSNDVWRLDRLPKP